MRIAVSGTHCSGKSSLIEEFLSRHSSYKYEPEPYDVLFELAGDVFPEATAESLFEQLGFNVDRLKHHRQSDEVIFERSPVDYVAYLEALVTLGRPVADRQLAKQSISIARDVIYLLDMIVFLPGHELGPVADDEDPELRDTVDTILEDYLMNDSLDMFEGKSSRVIQLNGSTAQRMRTLELIITPQKKEEVV